MSLCCSLEGPDIKVYLLFPLEILYSLSFTSIDYCTSSCLMSIFSTSSSKPSGDNLLPFNTWHQRSSYRPLFDHLESIIINLELSLSHRFYNFLVKFNYFVSHSVVLQHVYILQYTSGSFSLFTSRSSCPRRVRCINICIVCTRQAVSYNPSCLYHCVFCS